MRSEHNRGASLAAFLLAVSTMTLLFVSPVEGQVGDACVVTALPGETGSCDDESGGTPQYCGELTNTTTGLNQVSCQSCAAVYDRFIEDPTPFFCAEYWDRGQGGIDIFVPTTTITNCALSCFNATRCYSDADCPADTPDCTVSISGPFLVELNDEGFLGTVPEPGQCLAEPAGCATNADCPDTLPFCDIDCELFFPINVICTPGQCVATDPSECVVSALPGEDGSCPDAPQEGFAGPQICSRTVTTVPKTSCTACAGFEQFDLLTTLADCEILATTFNQTADVVANCQRECFGFYACATNADCPDTLPICNAGQCEISVFSPLAGMGGGSSA